MLKPLRHASVAPLTVRFVRCLPEERAIELARQLWDRELATLRLYRSGVLTITQGDNAAARYVVDLVGDGKLVGHAVGLSMRATIAALFERQAARTASDGRSSMLATPSTANAADPRHAVFHHASRVH